jgi:hypothetical protein
MPLPDPPDAAIVGRFSRDGNSEGAGVASLDIRREREYDRLVGDCGR